MLGARRLLSGYHEFALVFADTWLRFLPRHRNANKFYGAIIVETDLSTFRSGQITTAMTYFMLVPGR